MTEIEKLGSLRDKLIAKRRVLIESPRSLGPEELTRMPLAMLEGAIEAVDKAIEYERRTHSHPEAELI